MYENSSFVLCSARKYAYEDYLSALFSPREARQDLVTLAAYVGELNRIPLQVRDETLAEIRFQWWREVFEKGIKTGSPIADAMLVLKEKKGLPLDHICSDLEMRVLELDPQVYSSPKNRETYMKLSQRSYLQMRAFLLGYKVDGLPETLFVEANKILGTLRYCHRHHLLRALGKLSNYGALWSIDPQDSSGMVSKENRYLVDARNFIDDIWAAYSRLRTALGKLERGPHLIFLPLACVRSHLKVFRAVQAERTSPGSDQRYPSPLSLYLAHFFAAKFKVF